MTVHVEGSRKGKVHAAFDKHGADVAFTLGLKLKLQQSSLRSWIGRWRREDEETKAASKPKAKAKTKKKAEVAEAAPAA